MEGGTWEDSLLHVSAELFSESGESSTSMVVDESEGEIREIPLRASGLGMGMGRGMGGGGSGQGGGG